MRRRFSTWASVLGAVVCLTSVNGQSANAQSANTAQTFQQYMNLTTMLEASSSLFSTLSNLGGTLNGPFSWVGSFNDNGWSYSGSGIFGQALLSVNYSGTLATASNQDVTV